MKVTFNIKSGEHPLKSEPGSGPESGSPRPEVPDDRPASGWKGVSTGRIQRTLVGVWATVGDMRGDAEIITALNDILTSELTAINQYFVHYKMLENWGYPRLAKKKREESIEEMKHADRLIHRILYLEGIPNLQRLGPVKVGEEPVEMHKLDLELERAAVARLNKAVDLCLQKSDAGTRDLVESVLREEEEAIDWLEAQLGIVETIGRERYLAQQLHE
jgi:bacterioferritin